VRLSILDVASTGDSSTTTPAEVLRASLEVAQHAEEWGFVRYWFSEHHNMPSIVSSSPAVLAGYIAANTRSMRVGSGGVMLPNHAPLVIAEQFGTLETLYPGRIDLGVGRAPGTDMEALRALRRDPGAAERFPQDVVELQALLGPVQPGQRIQAVPGANTRVPIYILGSSLFGAQLAAILGLPYAFASHFAPNELTNAVSTYRREFKPSEQLDTPYVIAGMNVFAADTEEAAEEFFTRSLDALARNLGQRVTPPPPGDGAAPHPLVVAQARQMLTYAAVGTETMVRDQVLAFVDLAQADEVMAVTNSPDVTARLRSYELLARAINHP